ncbi:GTPase [Candidatus Micrarchaeota archaeon]|nr:GTPase [Candidatus Micrarchaeota archaeon]
MRRKVLIIGAAGRDFHNFNVFYRSNPNYEVVGFTAAQIPGIQERIYPKEIAGVLYPNGIPIYSEDRLEELVKSKGVDECAFAYSDVSHEQVMHLACRSMAVGASYILLGPNETMVKSTKKLVAVCATRTGAGKSPFSKMLSKKYKRKLAIIRHPMPYGELVKQEVQRFERMEDLDRAKCTIEEREEYEGHIANGAIVWAGVDYEKILRRAEAEHQYILWDGGNNDFPFYKPDLLVVVADALRPGNELLYYPGEVNFRMADIIVISKYSQNKKGAKLVEENAKKVNPKALVVKADIVPKIDGKIRGKKVVVIEDGPTVTHGGMPYGAGWVAAKRAGAKIVSPYKFAVGSIKETYKKYPHCRNVLPAMGYSDKQMHELAETIKKLKVDYVVSGTPMNLEGLLHIDRKLVHASYAYTEKEMAPVLKAIEKVLGE